MARLKKFVMEQKIVKHAGVSFTAHLVAEQPLNEFLLDHKERVYLDKTAEERQALLTEAHVLCTTVVNETKDGDNKSDVKEVAGVKPTKGGKRDNGTDGK